jgi:hypothetical protein
MRRRVSEGKWITISADRGRAGKSRTRNFLFWRAKISRVGKGKRKAHLGYAQGQPQNSRPAARYWRVEARC